jgi:hypothetical protein
MPRLSPSASLARRRSPARKFFTIATTVLTMLVLYPVYHFLSLARSRRGSRHQVVCVHISKVPFVEALIGYNFFMLVFLQVYEDLLSPRCLQTPSLAIPRGSSAHITAFQWPSSDINGGTLTRKLHAPPTTCVAASSDAWASLLPSMTAFRPPRCFFSFLTCQLRPFSSTPSSSSIPQHDHHMHHDNHDWRHRIDGRASRTASGPGAWPRLPRKTWGRGQSQPPPSPSRT